jgi:hypothetical protein
MDEIQAISPHLESVSKRGGREGARLDREKVSTFGLRFVASDKMKTLPLGILSFLVLSLGMFAQDFLPELDTASKAHKADSALLAQQKTASLESAKKPYLDAIQEADRVATTSGNLTVVREVAKERETVIKGQISDTPPANLPKALAVARKAYIRNSEKILADIGTRQKTLDTTYLKFLATLQQRAAKNSKLEGQIIVEKERLLTGVFGPITDLRFQLEGTKWRDAGTFRGKGEGGVSTFNKGIYNGTWKYEVVSPTVVNVIWGGDSKATFTLGKDGKTFIENGKLRFELIMDLSGK